MRFSEIIDEKGRMQRWYATLKDPCGLVWTHHHISYYELRNLAKDQGQIMGLEDEMQVEYQYVREHEKKREWILEMGLYDWVKVDFKCPHCKAELKEVEFQTHDFGRTFNKFEIGQEQNIIENGFCDMIAFCYKCPCCIKGFLHIKNKIITDLSIHKYSVDLEKSIVIKNGTKKVLKKQTCNFHDKCRSCGGIKMKISRRCRNCLTLKKYGGLSRGGRKE